MKKQPIRKLEKIEQIKNYLLENYSERDYFLFMFGINTGRRIGDILRLKVRDVRNKDHLILFKEEKTGKAIRLKLNSRIKKEIAKYCYGKNENDFLFTSRQKNSGKEKAISYQRAYQIIMKIFSEVKFREGGTHTLRKTFGYWHYKRNKDVEALRKIFNHSKADTTIIYIGVEADEIDKSIDKFGGL